MAGPMNATTATATIPAPGNPTVLRSTLPPMLPTRPRVMSRLSPWPPRFMTNPASKPASSPTRTHVANMTKLMTLPPSSGYGSAASLPPHRCTRGAPSPFAPVGWTRAQAPLAGGRSSRRPVAVLPHQESLEHFDCPLVQGPVVDHHLHGGAPRPPDPLRRRGGADDDVDSPDQTTEGGPLGGGRPGPHGGLAAGGGRRRAPGVGRLRRGGGPAHP